MFYFNLLSFKFLVLIVLNFLAVIVVFLSWCYYTNRGSYIFEEGKTSRTLVVILHGYQHTPRNLDSLAKEVHNLLPEADIFRPYYSSWLFSETDPIQLAYTLKDDIADYFNKKNYEKVILIGHSSGSVIIRKAYLFALGIQDDVPIPSFENPQLWTTKVERIITLAGMNRGFDYSKKSRLMNWAMYWISRSGLLLGEITGRGQFIRSFQRGFPFIANLRVQWIRLAVDERFNLPPTIQLIGVWDDIVQLEDNYDLASDRRFRNLSVPHAGHASIIKLDDLKYGAYRKSKFQYAIATPIGELNTQESLQKEPPSDLVVILQHGIRETTTLWRLKLKAVIEQKAKELDINAKVITPGYGYFPMARFLLYRARQRNVRLFMDDYTEALARNPKAEIHFFGHSNGTYLLAHALKNYATFNVNRVVLAGSVVRRDFPWDEYHERGRIEKIRNDVATGDWVVGIFPRLLEILKDDVGSAGHNGFIDNIAQQNSYPGYFSGDHGAAIKNIYHPSIAHFILTGNNIELKLAEEQNGFVVMLSKLSIVVWLIIISIITWIGWLILGHLGGIWLVIYLVFLIVLLYFI